MANPVTVPLINPNEPEAVIVQVYVADGDKVKQGDVLCTLETTKATNDLVSEHSGYIVGLRYKAGDTVIAGETLAYIAENPDWQPPHQEVEPSVEEAEPKYRITEPARKLLEEYQLSPEVLPPNVLITRQVVLAYLEQQSELASSEVDSTAIVIYGGGGHGKSVLELVQAMGEYHVVGFVDDGLRAGEKILGVKVLGGGEKLPELYAKGVRLAANAVGGIGNIKVRLKVFQKIRDIGFKCPVLVHPTAYIEPSAELSEGVQVFPHAYVGSDVKVGYGSIINTGAIVSHDCQLGDYVNISPGAVLAGGVQIGAESLVGMGVTINLMVNVGRGARLGNGATVKEDVPDKGIVRAGTIWRM